MRRELLPLFPLAVVLLPRNTLPLHIFEERYKEMIGLVIETGEEFGVVLAAKEGIARVGCTASIEQVLQRYPDGRLDIITLGR
jgi:Lon protease-like protein